VPAPPTTRIGPSLLRAGAAGALRALLHPHRRALSLTVVVISAGAWTALAVAGGALGHPDGHHARAGGPVGIAVAGWAVMVVAMMLPPALPMLDVLRALLARHRRAALLVAVAAAAFVAVWTAVGGLLVAADTLLRALAGPWLDVHPQLVPGLALVGAGLYQFTPLKRSCLRACRSPRGFAIAHWHGLRPAAVEVCVVAGAYALSCVGCCWALMAVSLVVGVAALPLMVVLAAVTAAERLARHGRSLTAPVGVVAVFLGLAVLLDLHI